MVKYKVGDKVRVKSDLKTGKMYGLQTFVEDMVNHLGKTVTITKQSFTGDYSILEDNDKWEWTDEMFDGLAEENHMSAEEVLEWMKDNYYNGNFNDCFGHDYEFQELFHNYSSSEVVSKIEEYERKKKEEENEIETEFRYVLRIIEDKDGVKKCVDENFCDDFSQEELEKQISDYLKEYCRTHEGKFFCTFERNCYVKNNK